MNTGKSTIQPSRKCYISHVTNRPYLYPLLVFVLAFSGCGKKPVDGGEDPDVNSCPDTADYEVVWRYERDTTWFLENEDRPPFLSDGKLVFEENQGFGHRYVILNLDNGQLFDQYFAPGTPLITNKVQQANGLEYYISMDKIGVHDPVKRSISFHYLPDVVHQNFLLLDSTVYMISTDSSNTENLLRYNLGTKKFDTVQTYDFPEKNPIILGVLKLMHAYRNGSDHVLVLKQDRPDQMTANFITYFSVNATTGEKMWSFFTEEVVPSGWIAHKNIFCYYEYAGSYYACNMTSGARAWTFTPHYRNLYRYHGFLEISDKQVYLGESDGTKALESDYGQEKWRWTQTGKRVYGASLGGERLFLIRKKDVVELNASSGCLVEKISWTEKPDSPARPRFVLFIEKQDILVVFTEKQVVALQKS